MNITEEVDTSYATHFKDSNQNAQRLVCIRLGYVLWYSFLGFRNRVVEAEFQSSYKARFIRTIIASNHNFRKKETKTTKLARTKDNKAVGPDASSSNHLKRTHDQTHATLSTVKEAGDQWYSDFLIVQIVFGVGVPYFLTISFVYAQTSDKVIRTSENVREVLVKPENAPSKRMRGATDAVGSRRSRRVIKSKGEFENEGFILDDLHDNEEDGQHIDDGKQKRRRKKRLTHFQSNKLAERLNGYKPLAELAMEQPSPVSVVDAFYTEDPPSPIQKKPCAYKDVEDLCFDDLQKIINIVSDAAKQRLKKKGMPLPPWRRADYVKAKRWVVEVMATANGYTIDDAIYRLTKLLRSLLNGRLARTISASSSSSSPGRICFNLLLFRILLFRDNIMKSLDAPLLLQTWFADEEMSKIYALMSENGLKWGSIVVEVMATANGYKIDDAIYRLTKLLRSLLNGRLARTIRTTSYEPATFPSLGKRKAHTELNFHGLQMHTQSIGRNLTPCRNNHAAFTFYNFNKDLAMEIDRISTIVFVLSGYISYWIIRLGIIIGMSISFECIALQARAFEDFDSLEDIPPATTIVSLVIYEASSDAKKAVAAAISSGVPSPLSGGFKCLEACGIYGHYIFAGSQHWYSWFNVPMTWWYDPPMCQRSVQIIPGLLRSRNELEEILAMVEEKRHKLLKFLIISWVKQREAQHENKLSNLMRQRQLLESVNYRRAITEDLERLPRSLVACKTTEHLKRIQKAVLVEVIDLKKELRLHVPP
ncbi:zinc finger, GRF-type containing protein [Tanacetum coccineum]